MVETREAFFATKRGSLKEAAHRLCVKSAWRSARQLLRTVAISCGAAVEGSPRRQRGLRYWQSEPRNGERKISSAAILSLLTGLLVMAHFSPRLTPWATFFRHTVADSLCTHCQNLTCAPLLPFAYARACADASFCG